MGTLSNTVSRDNGLSVAYTRSIKSRDAIRGWPMPQRDARGYGASTCLRRPNPFGVGFFGIGEGIASSRNAPLPEKRCECDGARTLGAGLGLGECYASLTLRQGIFPSFQPSNEFER